MYILMSSTKSGIRHDKMSFKKTYKLFLIVILITFAITMLPGEYCTGLIKPATAATLGNVRVVPMSNLATMQTTYDIIFTAATTAPISTVEMNFGTNFNIVSATRLIENSGIGSGSLFVSGSTLTYKVNNPTTIPVGTIIKLEIARIVANLPGNFVVSITTKNAGGGIIDGPTSSSLFQIFALGTNGIADKTITGNDVSPNFMIRKTVYDDAAGHAHGWDPNGSTKSFAIFDSDISGASDSEFINVMIRYSNLAYCTTSPGDTGVFVVHCDSAPIDSAVLDYVITKLPANVVTSTDIATISSSSIPSSPFALIDAK
jgi:hypothetical protein